ncbi:MAG: histone deacetylase [Crocinitomicaceae bacterium]|nr:histone deacetylase [Crocinitomicaceae bacterium]
MLKVAFHPVFIHPIPSGHRFPMEKYDLLPRQLLYEGTLNETNFFTPNIALKGLLETVHDTEYLRALFDLDISPRAQRKTGFIHCKELIERESRIVEGTRMCAEYALSCGAAMNIAGGTHHAFTNRGEGFCLMNDQAVAAKWLLDEGKASRILIIDLDVHQGNGTAEIFKDEQRVFTFSMHGRNNYPLKKESSDLDIELNDGTNDDTYMDLLERNLDYILLTFVPDFVFFQSGVDVLSTDKLGRLGMSIAGCKLRDQLVINKVKEIGIPLVCTMGGGYSSDVKLIIEAHSNTYRIIQEVFF